MPATFSAPTYIPAAVDFSKLFLPEQFTPLFHTSAYANLSAEQRRRYNQLYALYFNEQIIFFETSLSESVLLPLVDSRLPEGLTVGLREFMEEEQRHTRMFRALNEACAPDLYAGHPFYFIRVPPSQSSVLDWVARRPRVFPMVVWLMLLQEERSMFYSRTILRLKGELEPQFVSVHRAHLADEADHVRWDEDLLDQLWDRCHPVLRRINAEFFRWMVGEFFNTPKRGGLHVVSRLIVEFPELAPRLPQLRTQVRQLAHSKTYHQSLYSREMVPRTFARFDKYAEFSLLGRTLYGYERNPLET